MRDMVVGGGSNGRTNWEAGAAKDDRPVRLLVVGCGVLLIVLIVGLFAILSLAAAGAVPWWPGSELIRLQQDERVLGVGQEWIRGRVVLTITLEHDVSTVEGRQFACDEVRPMLTGGLWGGFTVQSWEGDVIATDSTGCD